MHTARTDEVLLLLANSSYEQAFEIIKEEGVNKRILSYLFVLHIFHEDKDIRKEARSIFRKNTDKDLQDAIREAAKPAYAKRELHNLLSHSYNICGGFIESHPQLDIAEAFVMFNILKDSHLFGVFTFDFATYLPDVVLLVAPELSILKMNRSTRYGDVENPEIAVEQVISQALRFPSLKNLDVSGFHDYEVLPESLLQLTSLEKLSLGENVKTLPNDLSKLKALTYLDITHNEHLVTLPEKLPPTLKAIDMQHTLFLDVQRDYADQYKQQHPQVKLVGYEW